MQNDRFEPQAMVDPSELRRLRVHLNQIDSATFEANRGALAKVIGRVDARRFQRLALWAAQARAGWVAELDISDKPHPRSPTEISRLSALRSEYQELAEAYEAMRRMVERGYICYLDKAKPNLDPNA